MKSQFLKWFSIGVLGLSLVACGNSKKSESKVDTAEAPPVAITGEAPKLSLENQQLADACSNNDQNACKSLVESLTKDCEKGVAQSCVDTAVIFIRLNDEAVKAKNNELALQSYNYAVGALIKGCELGNQSACKSLDELSQNIFNNLKTVRQECTNNKNQNACKVIDETKKVLNESCKAGRQKDCDYLKDLAA